VVATAGVVKIISSEDLIFFAVYFVSECLCVNTFSSEDECMYF